MLMHGEKEGRSGQVTIFTAKRAGFCFGVKRAIDISFDIAKEIPEGVYTLGPIIHNPQVIEKLKTEGIFPLNGVEDIPGRKIKALIIRTHGIPHEIYDEMSSQSFRLIDATCPFVKNAQHFARQLKENGYQVVILGDSTHPEVKGIMSYAGEDAVVVDENTQLPHLKTKVGIVVQTTKPVEALKKLLSNIIEHVKEVKVYNTICNSTALRLKETADMARKVDVMIIVGGKNSANTTQLSNLCRSLSVRTYHIETEEELKKEWFIDTRTAGVSAGASTPDWIIKKVEKRIIDIGEESCNGN
jgi:4-hydroxy-3-methylbut-2-enyl diphosphate reductase